MTDNRVPCMALQLSRAGGERLRRLTAEAPLIKVMAVEADPEEFERKAVQLQPPVLLVEFDTGRAGLADLLERLRRAAPRSAVMAVAEGREPEEILAAMRLGAREYIAPPMTGRDLNEAALRLMRQAAASSQPSGQLVAVLGAKGGVGASLLTLNLGWCLSQAMGKRVALLDLDLMSGDLAALLDLDPPRGLDDVAANFERMDALLLDSMLAEAAPGLRLLAAPADPAAAEDVRPEHLGRALDHLLDGHELALADLPHRLDDVTLAALDRAHSLVVVTEPTVVGLRAARRLVDLLGRLGHPPAKITTVLNRDGCEGAVSYAEARKVLTGGRAPVRLPNDAKTLMMAANTGSPVLREWPKSRWSKALAALAQELAAGLAGQAKEEAA